MFTILVKPVSISTVGETIQFIDKQIKIKFSYYFDNQLLKWISSKNDLVLLRNDLTIPEGNTQHL